MKKLIFASLLILTASSFAVSTSPESCQLKINGQVLFEGVNSEDGGFYSAISQYSQRNGICVHAKIDRVPRSGRVYLDGRLVEDNSGQKRGLTNEQAAEAKRNAGGRCQTVSCIPLQYNQQPQYEQAPQRPSLPDYPDVSGSDAL